MLEMMVYWEEEHNKLKTERSLRSRREVPKDLPSVVVQSGTDVSEVIELVKEQSEQIRILTKTLERVVMNGNGNGTVKTRLEGEEEEEFELPELRDNLDADVIDTSNIQVATGTAGNEAVTGENISDKIERLKKLKARRKDNE